MNINKTSALCWICGDADITGEHKIKRSDLKSELGCPTQTDPHYYSDDKRKNLRIGSLKSDTLKSPSRICAKCNNERTQPHDRAWETMSAWLRTRQPPIILGAYVCANRIFPYNTRQQMQNVHLYFIKLFGCHIKEAGIPIDLKTFANAILNEKAHPQVYLKFGRISSPVGTAMAGSTDIDTAQLPDGSCAFASWFYEIGELAINIMFAIDGEERQGLVGAWHPKFGTNKLRFEDLMRVS